MLSDGAPPDFNLTEERRSFFFLPGLNHTQGAVLLNIQVTCIQ